MTGRSQLLLALAPLGLWIDCHTAGGINDRQDHVDCFSA